MRRIIVTLALIVAVASAAALASAATRPDAAIANPPSKQVAALKKRIAALEAELAKLRPTAPAVYDAQRYAAREATAKYATVAAATAAGYAAASPCESLPQGGMGFHYSNAAAVRDPALDPAKPEVLLYAPVNGTLELVGVEYMKVDSDQNLTTDIDRPSLFGRAFDGPMLGHSPTMPIHYDLHVWVHKRNPSGVFAQWNPDVSCK